MSLETKTNLLPETIKNLQELIQVNLDSRDGFRQAAQDLQDVSIASLFQSLADQRNEQANELSQFVQLNHEQPVHSGSFAAALHRSWIALRELLSANDLYAVLAEAERGEDHIKEAYESSIRETAGSAVNDVLLRQFAQVKAAHDRVRDLRDEYKTA